jgi:hypothetical protein
MSLVKTTAHLTQNSPSQSYVTEREEGKTKDGKGSGGVEGRIGFFLYVLSLGGLLLPLSTSAG